MNLKKAKGDFLNGLRHDAGNYNFMQDILTAYLAGVNYNREQTDAVVSILKKIKALMDSENYDIDFDSLYDEIAAVLNKYDNQ